MIFLALKISSGAYSLDLKEIRLQTNFPIILPFCYIYIIFELERYLMLNLVPGVRGRRGTGCGIRWRMFRILQLICFGGNCIFVAYLKKVNGKNSGEEGSLKGAETNMLSVLYSLLGMCVNQHLHSKDFDLLIRSEGYKLFPARCCSRTLQIVPQGTHNHVMQQNSSLY